MQNCSIEVLKRISDFVIDKAGDHFSLFSVSKSFASAVKPAAQAWEAEFLRDEEIQREIEISHTVEDELRHIGFQYLQAHESDIDSDSDSNSTYFSESFWARWAGTP